jgi:hypothetical protein
LPKQSVILPVCKKGDKTDCSNYRGMSHLSTMQRKLLGIISMDFDGTGQLLIIYDDDDIFVNCNWVATLWQQYSTHIHTNNTQNDTKQTT